MNDAQRREPRRHDAWSFGPYRLIPARRLLLRGDAPVSIGSRALDILIALVEQAGSALPKDRLLAAAWPNTFVHEANLRVHIAGLRKLLGEGRPGERYIVNEAGRGYRFVAPVRADEKPVAAPVSSVFASSEPFRAGVSAAIGRAEIVKALVEDLPRRRLVTLVGPGGVGKTTVALAVAERVAREFPTVFVDLGPLADPSLVGSKICAALGLATRSDDPISELVAFLRGKRMLIALDTCEHVIEAVAPLIERAMAGAPGLQILATSREPLRAKGEWIHRLAPLATPGPEPDLRAEEALAFPAVRLFVERAGASLDGFELTDADAPRVARICRKLDGLPLAIELAASRIDAFGLKGLSDLLDRQFHLPGLGRRDVAARHRTLAATLDWSYETQPEKARILLRRLAVFAGPFTLEAATRVPAHDGVSSAEAVDCFANLVECSLIAADIGDSDARYRLLDTTRAYAFQKLRAADEVNVVARRHAEYFLALLGATNAEEKPLPAEWSFANRDQADNVRAALDWAFSESGNIETGVALTIAALPFWTHLSMSEECCARVETALARIDRNDPKNIFNVLDLTATFAGNEFFRGRGMPQSVAWIATLETAERLGDVDLQLRALWGKWLGLFLEGPWSMALDVARRFADVSKRSPIAADALLGERMLGAAHHFLGDQETAHRLTEEVLARYVPHSSHVARFQMDQRVAGYTILPIALWLRGFPDQAMRCLESVVDEPASRHAASITYLITRTAIPIALRVGDLAAADRWLDLLRERSSGPGGSVWSKWLRCNQAVRLIEGGDPASGAERLAAELNPPPTSLLTVNLQMLLCDLAATELRLGRIDAAKTTLDAAFERARQHQEFWSMPEQLRTAGEIAFAEGAAQEAEAHFLQSIEWARKQTAATWELRTATSLARLRQTQGRAAEGRAQLAAVYERFREGFATKDLRAAAALLAELGQKP